MSLRNCLSVLAGVLGVSALFGAAPASAFTDTYTFAGLQWGASPAEVIERLKKQGFAVGKKPVFGPRKEFAEQEAWGAFVRKDRGKRLIARGKVAGGRAQIELIFGWNDQLEHVIIGAAMWDGTIPGAERMTKFANRLAAQLDTQYGNTIEKRDPFGFIDTARWSEASDGSKVKLYVRGTNGYMFYPKDQTTLRVHFWNPNYSKAATQKAQNSRKKAPKIGNVPGSKQPKQIDVYSVDDESVTDQ